MTENNEGLLVIPSFSKEDFLTTSTPFKWIAETAKGDAFKQLQIVAQVAEAARKCGIHNFKTMFNNYLKSQKGEGVIFGNVMEFSGTALMWDTGEWIANDEGVYRLNSYGTQYACPHPIFILSRYTNVDTDAESVAVVYGRPGRDYKTKIVPRADLSSANKIVKLADYGVGVTSENARALVQYLNDFENINYDKIADMKSCDHMGWVGRGYKKFAPYISDLEFEGKETYKQLFGSVKECGSKDKWLNVIKNYRQNGNIVVRIVMAAAFASVLLKPLGALPFFVHMWGESETGKSVALLAAVSVWANPVIGKYAYTFNSTDVGNELYAACLNSLPLCIDELQILNKRSDFDDIIYRLCEGTGRLRGKREGGIQNIKTWHNCILTTGERPITSMSSGGGAVNRVIEIECNSDKFFQNPREFCRAIQANYGHAGKMFVEKLTEDNNIEMVRGMYERYIKKLEDTTEATDKQIASAAAILTADELAEQWIFMDNIRVAVNDMKPFLQTRDMLNVNKRGYEYLREEVIANYNNFSTNATECWGTVKDGCIYILKNRFNAILSDGDFNPQATLSWMARNGKVAKTSSGRRDTLLRINGGVTRCVCIYQDDSDNFTDIDDDDDLPFK